MRFSTVAAGALSCCWSVVSAQQYAGDYIPNSLFSIPGAELAFWKINDGKGGSNTTLMNVASLGSSGQRLLPANIKRVVIIIQGLNRDPLSYEEWVIEAVQQATLSDPNINLDSVAVVAPYFPNVADREYVYPYDTSIQDKGERSTSNVLVWHGSKWASGSDNVFPSHSRGISTYDVIDQMIQEFDNKAIYPNLNQIVLGGHSLGGQFAQRYAAISTVQTATPVSYWVANPDSLLWFNESRPYTTEGCESYDDYREGFTRFKNYPMSYARDLVARGRDAIYANYQTKAINYARGIQDDGSASSDCAPFTTGNDRGERFYNFLTWFPPTCPDPRGASCDTVDYMNLAHDGQGMIQSMAGMTRLLFDNFYGNNERLPDFGYPRVLAGDDPLPDPQMGSEYPNNVPLPTQTSLPHTGTTRMGPSTSATRTSHSKTHTTHSKTHTTVINTKSSTKKHHTKTSTMLSSTPASASAGSTTDVPQSQTIIVSGSSTIVVPQPSSMVPVSNSTMSTSTAQTSGVPYQSTHPSHGAPYHSMNGTMGYNSSMPTFYSTSSTSCSTTPTPSTSCSTTESDYSTPVTYAHTTMHHKPSGSYKPYGPYTPSGMEYNTNTMFSSSMPTPETTPVSYHKTHHRHQSSSTSCTESEYQTPATTPVSHHKTHHHHTASTESESETPMTYAHTTVHHRPSGSYKPYGPFTPSGMEYNTRTMSHDSSMPSFYSTPPTASMMTIPAQTAMEPSYSTTPSYPTTKHHGHHGGHHHNGTMETYSHSMPLTSADCTTSLVTKIRTKTVKTELTSTVTDTTTCTELSTVTVAPVTTTSIETSSAVVAPVTTSCTESSSAVVASASTSCTESFRA